MAGLTVYLLQKYGIDGYGGMLIFKQLAGWTFSIFIIGMFFYINVPIRNFLLSNKINYKTTIIQLSNNPTQLLNKLHFLIP